MLLVSFSCIEPTHNIEDKKAYVDKIFSILSAGGFIDAIVIDRPNSSRVEQNIVQEFIPGSYSTHHVHENLVYSGNTCTISSAIFEIHYVWRTYKAGLQFSVYIYSNGYEPVPSDDYVENLKFAIKSYIKNDWGKIEWLVDKDSECLAVELYPDIFRTENMIRQMISELMTKYYGASWWDKFVPYSIKKKYSVRNVGYKSVAPGFANIDDHLLSIDISDLTAILELKILKWQPAYNESINHMMNGLAEWNEQKVKEELQKQTNIELDFWNKHFSKYLPQGFLEELRKYEKNRNHVAHNKMLDRQAYHSIKNNVLGVYQDVSVAIDKIARLIISDEERELIEGEIEYQEVSYEEIAESEAGVEIRHDDEIKSILIEAFEQMCLNVEEALRFREDLEINILSDSISIMYKINEEKLIFDYLLYINDEQGTSSTCEIHSNVDFADELVYVNGAAEYNEEQSNYYPVTENEEPNIDAVASRVVDYVNDRFPNLRQKVDSSAYRIIKDGGEVPVLCDFSCEECGEFYVASDDTFAERGTCLNCGAKHEIYV